MQKKTRTSHKENVTVKSVLSKEFIQLFSHFATLIPQPSLFYCDLAAQIKKEVEETRFLVMFKLF